MNPKRPQIKLYCGHQFCVACVIGRLEEDNVDLSCPVCRKVLCLDVAGSVSKRSESLAELYSGYSAPYGPMALSTKQLRIECQNRGIQTLLRNDDRLRKMLLNESIQSSANRPRKPVPHFDLNTNVPINNGTDETSRGTEGRPCCDSNYRQGSPCDSLPIHIVIFHPLVTGICGAFRAPESWSGNKQSH